MTARKFAITNTQYVVFLVVFYVIILSVFSRNAPHFPYGDGPEYILMTESFYNHGTPDLRRSDVENYVKYLKEHNLTIHKEGLYADELRQPLEEEIIFPGYFRTETGTLYSYHFWLYSLVNVPARAVLDHLNADIRITFLATNLFLIFFGMWWISRLKYLPIGHRAVLSLLLIFSPTIWYIDWAHAEVWAGVSAFLGILSFFAQRKFAGLLFLSLAAVHYPPMFIPALFVFIDILYRNGFKIPVLLKLFAASFWIVLPPLFYYYHFGVPNLITQKNFLSTDLVNLKRLSSFFFDLNQGMILGIPLVLLLVIAFLIYDLVKRKWRREYIFLLAILLMSLIFMQMIRWNHGNSVVSRYVVWNAAILLVVFYERIARFRNPWFYIVSGLVVVSQVFVIFAQHDFNRIYWHDLTMNKLSRAVMDKYPSLYNPDPYIFVCRTNPYILSTTDSVHIYANENDEILKMMVKQGSISQLIERGVDPEKVAQLEKELKYYHGYVYINKPLLDKIGYDQSKDNYIMFIEQEKENVLKAGIRKQILESPGWLRKIEMHAIRDSIPLDSALQLNIDYMYNVNKGSN